MYPKEQMIKEEKLSKSKQSEEGNNYIYNTPSNISSSNTNNTKGTSTPSMNSVVDNNIENHTLNSISDNVKPTDAPKKNLDPHYLVEFNNVRIDVPSVTKIWSNVNKYKNITKSERSKLNDFYRNVTHLADKSNPSYQCLDTKDQNLILSWLKLANEIHLKMNSIQIIEDSDTN